MIRLLYDTTIGGVRFGQGALVELDSALENGLIAEGDATRAINFASSGLLPQCIAQSFAPVTRSSNNSTDAAYAVLTSVPLRGGTMGLNSKLVIVTDWDVLTTGNTKTVAVDFGGSNVFGAALSGTIITFKGLAEIQNLNSLSSQKTLNGSSYQTQAVPRLATSIDTSVDVAIDFKCKWSANSAGTETITLLGYSIWHYPAL